MLGLIVKHTSHGIGKVAKEDNGYIAVDFLESGQRAIFEKSAFSEKELKRHTLPKKSICSTDGRKCVIEALADSAHGAKRYRVSFQDDGLQVEVSEVELTPTGLSAQQLPLEKLQNQDQGSYSLFAPRERLVAAIHQQLKNGNGLRALLSSRIDLRPHQAFVAGVVLLDESRRFLLADEVGLGKTIEAGIVIHDLMISKPDARILILCPGALTQQWLCELYSKFSGEVFRMLELINPETENWENVSRLIASYSDGGLTHSTILLNQKWDMVVVDEVHHLLSSQPLYEFVHQLSRQSSSVLLLSALPAKRREDEFLRLLALLEPERYTDDIVADKEAFQQLFDNQRAIGRKMRLVRRRLEGLSEGNFTGDEVLEQISELATFEGISRDENVADYFRKISQSESDCFRQGVEDFLHYVGNRYRINQRILRNRRQRLIEDEQIARIDRTIETVEYESDQLEHEVNSAINELLRNAVSNRASVDVVHVFAAILWQSAVHPIAVFDLLTSLGDSEPGKINARGREFLQLGYLESSVSWESYCELLCRAIRPFISDELIADATRSAERWNRSRSSYSRFKALISYLESSRKHKLKILVFAGYHGVAEAIANELRSAFGEESTTEFRAKLGREEKEANVRDFRSNPSTWIMVSDESGGEGRNFQFADVLVHYDTPWNVSRVEQRIGRLDRLGREIPEVKSIIVLDSTSVESALVKCYRDGLGVFSQSISGLEFALRDVESQMICAAIESGKEGLLSVIDDIQDTVHKERERDDSEAVLDEASFDRKTAERFLRVRSSEESERELEQAFLSYFRMIATGAKPISDPEFPDGLWAFDAGRIHQLRSVFTNQMADRQFKGTFRRHIAQRRIDLDYFGVGNELFDAIYHSLHSESLGRTYAIEIKRPDVEIKWLGFEFVFYPSPNIELIGDNPGLRNRARQYFNFRPIHVFCSPNGQVAAMPELLLSLRQSLQQDDKDKTWSNFTGSKARQLGDLFLRSPWEDVIQNTCDTSRKHALQECRESVSAVVDDSLCLLDAQIRTVTTLDATSLYLQPLRKLRNSIVDWSVELDSLGFLAVNAGLRERLGDG